MVESFDRAGPGAYARRRCKAQESPLAAAISGFATGTLETLRRPWLWVGERCCLLQMRKRRRAYVEARFSDQYEITTQQRPGSSSA